MATKTKSLDDLAKKDFERLDLTTGDIALILQFSQQHAVRLCAANLLEHYTIGRGDNRIKVRQLVDFVQKGWEGLKTNYLQQQLLHFMEVSGLDPEEKKYGLTELLTGLVGKDGLRFHTRQKLYTTGEAKRLMSLSKHKTVKDMVDEGRLEGYKLPNSDFRRVLASGIARYLIENKIELGESIETSPELITYPDPCVGYERYKKWKDGTKVAEGGARQSVWYRYPDSDKVHEVSIRKNKDYGGYIKLVGIGEDKPRIDIVLLCKANRNSDGGILPKGEHLERVNGLLELGKSLLSPQTKAFDVVSKAQERLIDVYFQNQI